MSADAGAERGGRLDRVLRWALTGFFGLVLVALATRHEIWRDEGQAWLLARDAPSVGFLLAQLGYEGSPGLWHLLLRPFARAGLPVEALQCLNIALATTAVGLLALRSPLRFHEVALIALGWPVLGLYGVVVRSYTLSMLLAWLAASLHTTRRERPWRHAALLALLANTNLHSALFAACLGGELLWTLWLGRGWRGILPVAVTAAGLALAAAQVSPPADIAPHLRSWHPPVLLLDWRNWLPVLGRLFLLRAPRLALAYAVTCVGLELLFRTKYPGMPWHRGMFAVDFVACLWMAQTEPPRGPAPRWRAAFGAIALACVLAFTVPRAARSAKRDWHGPYSAGKDVAAWLGSHDTEGQLLVIYPCYLGAAVLPHMPGRATGWYCEYGREGSYTTWNRAFHEAGIASGGAEALLERVREAARGQGAREALLVYGYPGTLDGIGGPEPLEQAGAELLARFDGAEALNESMAVLRVRGE